MLWKVTHEGLKTCSLLWYRKVLEEPSYILCGDVFESTLQMIRDCEMARRIWEFQLRANAQLDFWNIGDTQKWLKINMKNGMMTVQWGDKHKSIFSDRKL